MKENLNDHNEAALNHPSEFNAVRLSPHFKLSEFLNLRKHPGNFPTMQVVANLTYGCHQLLEPARLIAGPIIINSGFRCEAVIRPKDASQFPALVDFLKKWEYTDQLLTGSGWLHISWNPFSPPRHYIRIGYYK